MQDVLPGAIELPQNLFGYVFNFVDGDIAEYVQSSVLMSSCSRNPVFLEKSR
jgi:hypothetical protein